MSLNHPSISHRVQEIDRLALLAEAAEERRAAEGRRGSGVRAPLVGTRRRLAAGLIAAGARLQGTARPVGTPATLPAR